jgi:sulfate permease, SulP family
MNSNAAAADSAESLGSAGSAVLLPPVAAMRRPSLSQALRLRPEDLRAAWVSALVMLPQAIAFSMLAGLPPEMGIYSSVIPVIVASLLGPSALLLSGPNSSVAVMLGAALLPLAVARSPDYLVFAAALTAMVGLAQIVFALGGVGRLLALLPSFTPAGLNMGIGCIMLTCQIAPTMGMLGSRDFPPFLVPVMSGLRWQDANPWALGVTVVSIAAGLVFERLRKPWMPSLVAALLFGALAGWMLDLTVGMAVTKLDRLGHLHLELEVFQWPRFHADELYVLKQLAVSAVGIALVGSLQSVIILQSNHPGADHRQCRRELFAQAGSNLTASLCGGFACSGSFNRTASHIEAGAATRVAAVLSSLILLILALLAAPAFAYIPRAAIAGTLMLVGRSMIRSGWRSAFSGDKWSRNAALFLGLCVPIAGMQVALVAAALVAVGRPLLNRSRPSLHAT